jgi:2-oxoglutarate ferredoxin oxidoreductase subunit alpha
VGHAHVRHLNPFPSNLEDILGRFRTVLIPEVNLGQLRLLIRARYLVDAVGLNKVRGKPYRISEIEDAARQLLPGGSSTR